MFPRSALWVLALLPCPLLAGEPPRLDRYGDPLPPRAVARMGTARLRVDERVLAFAFWPDNQTLAACCRDGSVRFWDRSTGRETHRVQIPLDYVRAAVFVPGMKAVALLGERNKLLLWDTAAAKTSWSCSLPEHVFGEMACLAVSPDGKLLAVPDSEKEVGLYETTTGRKIRSLKETDAKTLVFSPDSSLLAIASSKPPVQLWDIRSGKKLRDLPSPDHFLNSPPIAFSHNGKWVAVGGVFRNVYLSEVGTGKEVSRLKFKEDFSCFITQGGLLFTNDDKTLITGHYPGEVHFWDPATGKERFARKTSTTQGAWPVLSRDGKHLAVGDQQGWGEYQFIHLLDPATGKDVGPPADVHDFPLKGVAFSLDGKMLLCGDRQTLREWKIQTGKPGWKLDSQIIPDYPVFSADRKLVAQSSLSHVDIWEMGRQKPIRSLEYKGKDAIRAVAFSPDGKYLVSAHNHCSPQFGEGKSNGQDGLHIWDLATGKEIRSSITAAADLYSQLVITPDGRTAIAGSVRGRVTRFENGSSTATGSDGAGQLYLWELPSGREIRTLEGHKGAIRTLALSSDGRLLASGSADGTARLWELVSGKTLFTLPMTEKYHPDVALSPDGRLLAVDNRSVIRLYSTTTGKPVLELRGHNSEVQCLAFSPDGRRLASGLRDGTALVWDVTDACRAVRPEARQLNAKELETLWTDLADTDAMRANRAIWTLTTGGDRAVEMLKGRLRPAERVEPTRFQKLLAELDADQFAVREAAMKELATLAERAEPALSAALKNRPSLEARKRIEELLTQARRREWKPEKLRAMRAVKVLEQVSTAEARKVLRSLANGSADAWLTQESKASLSRLNPGKSEPRP